MPEPIEGTMFGASTGSATSIQELRVSEIQGLLVWNVCRDAIHRVLRKVQRFLVQSSMVQKIISNS